MQLEVRTCPSSSHGSSWPTLSRRFRTVKPGVTGDGAGRSRIRGPYRSARLTPCSSNAKRHARCGPNAGTFNELAAHFRLLVYASLPNSGPLS
jgi:hypothetical protein